MSIKYLINCYKQRRNLIFDLDDTIYPEQKFLFAVYKEIAQNVNITNQNKIYKFLIEEFKTNGRASLFDKLLAKFENKSSLNECLDIMRNYIKPNSINTYNWFKIFSKSVCTDLRIKIITNGFPNQQKNKIKSINFPKNIFLEEIIYAQNTKPKPSRDSFYELKNWKSLNKPIYIGDSLIDSNYCDEINIEFYDVNNLKKIYK